MAKFSNVRTIVAAANGVMIVKWISHQRLRPRNEPADAITRYLLPNRPNCCCCATKSEQHITCSFDDFALRLLLQFYFPNRDHASLPSRFRSLTKRCSQTSQSMVAALSGTHVALNASLEASAGVAASLPAFLPKAGRD